MDAGAALLVPEVFLTGDPPGSRTPVKDEEKYAGYNTGYNRSIVANRAHDLLTAVAFAKTHGARHMRLVASGGAGVWALPARALAGAEIERAAIDLGGFDFDQITRVDDDRLLPGALKYGGVTSLVSLCTEGRTTLFGMPAKPATSWAPRPSQVTLATGDASPLALVRAVLR